MEVILPFSSILFTLVCFPVLCYLISLSLRVRTRHVGVVLRCLNYHSYDSRQNKTNSFIYNKSHPKNENTKNLY